MTAPNGVERRQRAETVSRGEFCEFRSEMRGRMDGQDAQLAKGTEMFGKLETALFAKDDKNPNGQVGLMVASQEMMQHIKTVCLIGRGVVKAAAFFIMCGALAGAARALGML